MMRRMVRAQQPHCALQPRQWKTCPVVRGTLSPDDSAERTSWSVKTLQEQTIIAGKVLEATPCPVFKGPSLSLAASPLK